MKIDVRKLVLTVLTVLCVVVLSACPRCTKDEIAVTGGAAYPSVSSPPDLVETGENDVAVIFGIEDYAYLPDIPGVRDTVQDWENFFVRGLGVPSSRVFVKTDSDGYPSNILKFARRAAKTAKPGGRVWFVYVGHGVSTQSQVDPSERDGHLVGVDARSNPQHLEQNSVRRGELIAALEKGRQKETVVILDACFSGKTNDGRALAEGTMAAPPTVVRSNYKEQSTLVLSAAKGDQYAGALPRANRPVFSYLLLGALRGWADDGDGKVTAAEAVYYARRQMRHLEHDQEPVLDGQGEVVLSRGGRDAEPGMARLMRGEPNKECKGGKVASADTHGNCCWPGQAWSSGRKRCVGIPTECPSAMAVRGQSCQRAFSKEYARIPAGTFGMGMVGNEDRPNPQWHFASKVTITRPFFIKRTEVTQGEWKALMGSNPSYFDECGDDCPVESVSWLDAVTYLNRLSQKEGLEACYELAGCTGTPGEGCSTDENNGARCSKEYTCSGVSFKGLTCQGYRLPTEAEWEKAARAGTKTDTYAGNLERKGEPDAIRAHNASLLDDIAVYGANSGVKYAGYDCSDWKGKRHQSNSCGPSPAGSKKPNEYGLYDMLGNVSEWTHDRWSRKYPPYDNFSGGADEIMTAVNPTGPETGSDRLFRGCGWFDSSVKCDVMLRAAQNWSPSTRTFFVGFRPARTVSR